MVSKVEKELQTVTGVTPNKGEDVQAYLKRLYDKVNVGLSDAQWGKLSEDAQNWANAVADALDDKKAIPLIGGAEEESEESSSEEQEEEEQVNTKAAKKSGKKEAPAKEEKKAAPKGKATEAKTDKKAAPAKEKESAGRGRKGSYPEDSKIRVLVKDNPHRKGSKDFEKYKALSKGTVGKAVEAGADWGYMRYAVKREIISISA